LVFGGIGANAQWGTGSWTPGPALDLEGGTQLILPPTAKGAEVSDTQIQEAIRIMRQRVNATGVSEAQISRQGGTNIVVKLPGDPSQETIDLVQSSAQLRFRPVLTAAGPAPINPQALEQQKQKQQQQGQGGADSGQQQGQQKSDQKKDQASSQAPTADPAGGTVPRTTDEAPKDTQGDSSGSQSDKAQGDSQDKAGQDSTEPAQDSTAAPQQQFTDEEIKKAAREAADVNGDGKLSDQPESAPKNASDTAWMTEKVLFEFYQLDCTDPSNRAGGGATGEPDQPVVACAEDGSSKYILGPTEIEGTQVASANSALETTAQGAVTNNYIVQLSFNDEGAA